MYMEPHLKMTDLTPVLSGFKKKGPAGFSLRFLDLRKRRADRIFGLFRIKTKQTDRILCVFEELFVVPNRSPFRKMELAHFRA